MNLLDPSSSAPLERYILHLSQGGGAYVESGGRADFVGCNIISNQATFYVSARFLNSLDPSSSAPLERYIPLLISRVEVFLSAPTPKQTSLTVKSAETKPNT